MLAGETERSDSSDDGQMAQGSYSPLGMQNQMVQGSNSPLGMQEESWAGSDSSHVSGDDIGQWIHYGPTSPDNYGEIKSILELI